MNVYINREKIFVLIHPIVYLILVIAFITNYLKTILILYAIVFIHEIFHLITAHVLNVPIIGICIMPYGITLKIKNNRIQRPEHEVLIAAAGPFANLLMILCAYVVRSYCPLKTDDMTFFIYANSAIAVVNLVPALPLDGGRILKAALTIQWGYVKAFNFTMKVTRICIVILFMLGIWVVYITHFNISLFLISSFLLWNLSAERKNVRLIAAKEMIYCKEKLLKEGVLKAKNMVALYDIPARKLLNYFSYNFFYLITVIDSKMSIMGTVTETQVVEALIRQGSHIKLGDLFDNNIE